jgi:Tfp pilus assembly protein PilO
MRFLSRLRDVRVQLMIVAAVLLVIDVAAVALLLSPAGRGRAARQQAYETLRRERIEKTAANQPLQGMDEKITTAHTQEAQFDKVRIADHYSAVSDRLASLAKEAGVTASNVRYDAVEETGKIRETPAGYDKVGITILVNGAYEQDMRFINAVERQPMMLMIDAVSFNAQTGNQLSVTVHLSTYLRRSA